MMRARLSLLCLLGAVGCVGVGEIGVARQAQSDPDPEPGFEPVDFGEPPEDCRADWACEGLGASTPPAEVAWPPDFDAVPTWDDPASYPEPDPAYADHTDEWISGVGTFAERNGVIAGFPTFTRNPETGDHRVVVLWSTAVAFRETAASEAIRANGNDIAAVFRSSQAYARSRGFGAALPFFERQVEDGREVDVVALLSPDAIEVRFIDIDELGVESAEDVGGMFVGAARYAEEQGYPGAFPTFDAFQGDGRTIVSLVLIDSAHGFPFEVAEAEISPFCGRYGRPICDQASILCIPGHWPEGEICIDTSPSCGGPGQGCCDRTCQLDRVCDVGGGYSTPRNCVPPDLHWCGDGTCDAGERCICDKDCGGIPVECAPLLCTPLPYDVCVTCPGGSSDETRWACEDQNIALYAPASCTAELGRCP